MEIRNVGGERTLGAWQRAAQRALAADLPHQLRQRGGTILVPSKTEQGRVYHVQLVGSQDGACDCDAGLHGRPCAHKAAVALRLAEKRLGARITRVRVTPGMVAAYVRAA
jgi:uncharacterized Zn finger protein